MKVTEVAVTNHVGDATLKQTHVSDRETEVCLQAWNNRSFKHKRTTLLEGGQPLKCCRRRTEGLWVTNGIDDIANDIAARDIICDMISHDIANDIAGRDIIHIDILWSNEMRMSSGSAGGRQ